MAFRNAESVLMATKEETRKTYDYRANLGMIQHNVAEALKAQKRVEEALVYYEKAIANQRAALDANPGAAFSRQALSDGYWAISDAQLEPRPYSQRRGRRRDDAPPVSLSMGRAFLRGRAAQQVLRADEGRTPVSRKLMPTGLSPCCALLLIVDTRTLRPFAPAPRLPQSVTVTTSAGCLPRCSTGDSRPNRSRRDDQQEQQPSPSGPILAETLMNDAPLHARCSAGPYRKAGSPA